MSVQKYIPHRSPILLIDEIISHSDSSIICSVDWSNKSFFHDKDGTLLFSAMIEMIAQSAAAMYGIKGSEQDHKKLGMLTGVKKFDFFALPQGKSLLFVEINIEGSLGHHQVVKGQIKQENTVIAEGLIFLYLSE